MKHRDIVGGYTVVEVMIFLAVSGMLFASAAVLISGQQAKTEFSQAVRDFETNLSDITNDVATGLYTNTNQYSCETNGPSDIRLIAGVNQQGSNAGCIYLGKVVHFAPSNGGPGIYRVYTAIGKQREGLREVQNLDESMPLLAIQGSSGRAQTAVPLAADSNETFQIPSGVTVGWVRVGATNKHAVAMLTSFNSYNNFGIIESSSIKADMYAIEVNPPGGTNPVSSAAVADLVANNVPLSTWALTTDPTIKNPVDGIQICLQSAGSNQHAIVVLGGSGGSQVAASTIQGGPC